MNRYPAPGGDVWFFGFPNYMLPSSRRRSLEALYSRYNHPPGGKQLPAAYIDLGEPATPHWQQQQQQLPLPNALCALRQPDASTSARTAKIVFLLRVRTKLDHPCRRQHARAAHSSCWPWQRSRLVRR
jgi:hypothetical protein